ncbi:MAG: hypothetical protein WD851_12660 [Pirellulales bacterium]
MWDADVEAHFIGAWVSCDSQARAVLTDIANWVDRNLADDPNEKGRAIDDLAARILAVPVSASTARVSVTYQVLTDDRQVRVVRLTIRGG